MMIVTGADGEFHNMEANMTRDLFIKQMLPEAVCMTPVGNVADQLTPEEFREMADVFIERVLEIGKADIEGLVGYGEFDEENRLEYATCREFLEDTFCDSRDDYWHNWREMFHTTMMSEEFFELYYAKMLRYSSFCEGRRYLVNNNTFFVNMIVDQNGGVGFPDWSRAGIADFLLDIAIMDLNKPYLQIPEHLYAFCKECGIVIEHFHERYLCMAFYKGLDTLRWHASIDDEESCRSIMRYLEELEDRICSIA